MEKIGPPDEDGCRLWNASGDYTGTGYGKFWNGERKVGAHVYAYTRRHGPLPDGHEVHHTCGKKRCVEETHLVAVTRSEHNAATFRTDRPACPRGHEWTEASTYIRGYSPLGRPIRECRRCKSEKQSARDRAARAAARA